MLNTMEQSLSQTMAATFEELAFICPDTKLSDAQCAAPVDVAMSVSFEGPLSGRLVLRATSTILPAIAENMLGIQAAASTALQRDALGELANVMCGNLLPRIGGAQAVFVLTAPHEYVTGSEPAKCAPMARATIGIEEGRAVAQLLFTAECLESLSLAEAVA